MEYKFRQGDVVKCEDFQNFYGYVTGYDEDEDVTVRAFGTFYQDKEKKCDAHFIWPNESIPKDVALHDIHICEDKYTVPENILTRISNPQASPKSYVIDEGCTLEVTAEGPFKGTAVWVAKVINQGLRDGGPDILLCITQDADKNLVILLSDMVDTVKVIPTERMTKQVSNIRDVMKDFNELTASIMSIVPRLAAIDAINEELTPGEIDSINNDIQSIYSKVETMRSQYKTLKRCMRCGKYFFAPHGQVYFCDMIDDKGQTCSVTEFYSGFHHRMEADRYLDQYYQIHSRLRSKMINHAITEEQFNNLIFIAQMKLVAVRAGTITPGAYEGWIQEQW